MITPLYLTPASISYLTQFILSLAITGFLVYYLRSRSVQLTLLTVFFAIVTLFIGSLFLDATFMPFQRLLVVYSENFVLGLALIFLIQFAYHFPALYPSHRWEARAGLLVSIACLAWEGGFMVYRYVQLLGHDTVYYRSPGLAYANALVLLWVPFAFLRQCLAADPRPARWWLKLVQPAGREAQAARSFILIFFILFMLGVINVLRGYDLVSATVYNLSLSIGILIALWMFSSTYINFIPGQVSFLAKLSIVPLTLFLAILGSVGWMIVPPLVGTYQPNLADHQTLRFTPVSSGMYAVQVVDFNYFPDLGDRLTLEAVDKNRNQKIDFTFPFFGQTYHAVYVASSGVISMGEMFWQPNMQAGRSNLPAIFPLMIDLDPTAGGGVYARVDEDKLVVTWDHIPSYYHPEHLFTFQSVLYRDGVVEITYNGLPSEFEFDPDSTPSANPWVRGLTSGLGECIHTSEDRLPEVDANDCAVIENYFLDFRRYLSELMVPLARIVIGGSLVVLLILPLLLRRIIIKPLDNLLAGVRKMQDGELHVVLEIQNQDEVGFITGAFNTLAARLDHMVRGLEERVEERTSELASVNEQLRKLSIAVEQSPSSIIITNTEGQIEYVNSSFMEATGYTPEEAMQLSPHEMLSFLASPDVYDEMLDTILAGQVWRCELVNRKKNGETFWEYTVIAPIYQPDGEVTHFVAVKEDITMRKQAEQEMERLVITDPLTDLFNRRYFFDQGEKVFSRSCSEPYELALLMIDLDHFKKLNDLFGHQIGDECLVAVGQRLLDNARPTDIVARYGGEEFVALLPRVTAEEALAIAERIREEFENAPIEIEAEHFSVMVSIGIAVLDKDTASLDEMLTRADGALYEAKNTGRNRCVVWHSDPGR